MRWIVDGMNVIGSRPDGWWKDRWGAMRQLVDRLDTWSAEHSADVTVVFERPPTPPIASARVTVSYAPAAAPDSADDEIVRMVSADEHPSDITVATSDTTLARRVEEAGASVFAAKRFRELIDG